MAARTGFAIAGYRAGDQIRVLRPQFFQRQSKTRQCAGCQILYHHIGAGDHIAQQGQIARLLQVKGNAFLASVEPDEISAVALGQMIIPPGEVSFRSFNLDHPGAGIGQPAGRIRRCYGLFDGDNGDAFQILHCCQPFQLAAR